LWPRVASARDEHETSRGEKRLSDETEIEICHDSVDAAICKSVRSSRGPYTVLTYRARKRGTLASVRILLIEDEASLREGLVDLLEGDGHEVTACKDGTSGLASALGNSFDVLVIDWMLPGVSGIDICRKVRQARPTAAMMLLTARGDEADKLQGLGDGADDYVTKPFSARELLARVRALGRRAAPQQVECVSIDGATIDFARLCATRNGVTVELAAREVGILRLLHHRDGRVVSRSDILEQVFGQRGDLQTRAVDMAIAVLRKKIERDPGQPVIVVSLKGAGYAWGSASRQL
jgi:DNA-binding response OmpR family regulator